MAYLYNVLHYKTKRTKTTIFKRSHFNSFSEYLLSTYFVPGTILSDEDSAVNRTNLDTTWCMYFNGQINNKYVSI